MASDNDDRDLTISKADELRRRILRSKRARLRSNVAELIRIINKPLADVIRDHALPHLSVQSLRCLRSVSSSWNSRITSPIFALTHSYTPRSPSGLFSNSLPLSFTPFDPDSHSIPDPSLSFLNHPQIVVISSSNGIVLCSAGRDYLVCNPSTMEWTPLPKPKIVDGPHPNAVLVFNPSPLNCGSDYSVVVPFKIGGVDSSGVFGFNVFSSASGVWRSSQDICYAESIVADSGISAGDVACWRTSMQTVVIFDPTADTARTVEWPMGYYSEHVTWELGAVAGGRLCCVAVTETHVSVFILTDGCSWVGGDYLVFSRNRGLWEWVEKGECSGGEVCGDLRPLRSQSGNLDVVVLTVDGALVLDLVRRRVRFGCDLPGVNWECGLVAHINTLARVYPHGSIIGG